MYTHRYFQHVQRVLFESFENVAGDIKLLKMLYLFIKTKTLDIGTP